MIKKVIKEDAFYTLAWSVAYKYDKYNASRVLPELAGILSFFYIGKKGREHLLFYGCWRDGCREGMRKLLSNDPMIQRLPDIIRQIDIDMLYYRYTIVDTTYKDMQDIMYWLISTYRPKFNDKAAFSDSKRYRDIAVKETEMRDDQVVERFPRR